MPTRLLRVVARTVAITSAALPLLCLNDIAGMAQNPPPPPGSPGHPGSPPPQGTPPPPGPGNPGNPLFVPKALCEGVKGPQVVFDFSADRRLLLCKDNHDAPLSSSVGVMDGSIIGLRVANVNRFLYNVTLKAERVEMFRDVPGVFKTALLPAEKPAQAATGNAVGDVREKYQAALNSFNNIDAAILDVASLDETITAIASRYRTLTPQTIADIQTNATIAATGTATSVGPLQTILMLPAASLQQQLAQNSGVISNSKAPAIALLRSTYQELVARANDYIATLPDMPPMGGGDTKPSITAALAKATTDYNKIITADTVATVGQPTELTKEFNASADVYESVRSGTSFYALTSVRAGADRVKMSYEIKPKQANDSSLETLSDDLAIPVYGGFHIDFSTGIFASWLTDLNAGTITQNNQTIVVDKGSDKTVFPLGGLAHIYWRMQHPILGLFQPALSVGAATNGKQTQLIAGGSILMGSDRRFVLTVGRAFGPVKRLAPGVSLGQPLPAGITESTFTKNTDAWVVGLTFNLK